MHHRLTLTFGIEFDRHGRRIVPANQVPEGSGPQDVFTIPARYNSPLDLVRELVGDAFPDGLTLVPGAEVRVVIVRESRDDAGDTRSLELAKALARRLKHDLNLGAVTLWHEVIRCEVL